MNLAALKREAKSSASRLGHKMGNFRNVRYSEHESICTYCGCWLRVNMNPMPNEIDIAGDVFAVGCLGPEQG